MFLKERTKIFFFFKMKTFLKYLLLLDIIVLNYIVLNQLNKSFFNGIHSKRLINDTKNPKYLKINRERYNVDCKKLFDKNNNKNEFTRIEEMLKLGILANSSEPQK
jgi:hypothetical protein